MSSQVDEKVEKGKEPPPVTTPAATAVPPPAVPKINVQYQNVAKVWTRAYAQITSTADPIRLEEVQKIIKRLVLDINDEISDPVKQLEKEQHLFLKEEIGAFACVAILKAFHHWMKTVKLEDHGGESLEHYVFDEEEIEPMMFSALKHFNTDYMNAPLKMINYAKMLYSTSEEMFAQTVSPVTHEWLMQQARIALQEFDRTIERVKKGEKLDRERDIFINPTEVKHLQMLAEGGLPWGYEPLDAPFKQHFKVNPFTMVFDVETIQEHGGRCVVELPEQTWNMILATAKEEMEKVKKALSERPPESVSEAERQYTGVFLEHLEKIVREMKLPEPFVLKREEVKPPITATAIATTTTATPAPEVEKK